MDIIKNLFAGSHGLLLGLIGIMGIALLIFVHECGHFIMCKIFGVRTPSFSIGFGPRLLTKKIGGTEFSISAFPFGGYVEIAGNAEIGQGEQKEAHAQDEGSFAVRPFYQKFLIMIGGILFNILFSYFIFVLIFATGIPKSEFLYPINTDTTIETIEKDSQAAKTGLQVNDHIISIDDINVEHDTSKLLEIMSTNKNKTVMLSIVRNNIPLTVPITLETKDMYGKTIINIGIRFLIIEKKAPSFIEAIKQGISVTNKYIAMTAYFFKYMFTKRDMSGVGGPLTIIHAGAQGAAKGLKIFLVFLAIISINLAILNLVPLPIFDGGQILLFGIEAIIRRPLAEKARMIIHLASWGLIMLLFVYVTFKDIIRIAQNYIGK